MSEKKTGRFLVFAYDPEGQHGKAVSGHNSLGRAQLRADTYTNMTGLPHDVRDMRGRVVYAAPLPPISNQQSEISNEKEAPC